MSVTKLSSSEFRAAIEGVETIAVVKFYGSFCRLCTRIAPEFEKVSKDYEGQASFFEVHVAPIDASQHALCPGAASPDVACVLHCCIGTTD